MNGFFWEVMTSTYTTSRWWFQILFISKIWAQAPFQRGSGAGKRPECFV